MSDEALPASAAAEAPGFAQLVYEETERINTRKDGGKEVVTKYSPLTPDATVEARRALERAARSSNDWETLAGISLICSLVIAGILPDMLDAKAAWTYVLSLSLALAGWVVFFRAWRKAVRRDKDALANFDEDHPLYTATERAFGACTVFQRHADALVALDPPGDVLDQVAETRGVMTHLLAVASDTDEARLGTKERAVDEMVRHAAETAALRALAERRHALIEGRSPAELLAIASNRSLAAAAGAIVQDHRELDELLNGPRGAGSRGLG